MKEKLDPMIFRGLTRRDFLRLSALSAAGLALGCAVDPVTGKNTFNLMSEGEEVQVDRQYSPHQFSSDYGVTQDRQLNTYMASVGKKMAVLTHRPQMPYSFQVVNAVYVNAYAFPGGTIAATRGILLKMDNEAELAALLGHELGHVNARHTAEQMSKGQVTSLVIGLGQAVVAAKYSQYADIAQSLGQMGAGMLLASYSRDNEREADDLGNQYMVKAGYNTSGFVGLMNMLNTLSKNKPGSAEILFSTHPMSDERYQTAAANARDKYQTTKNYPVNRERYMDSIKGLRDIQGAIENLQKGEEALGRKQYPDAESLFRQALRTAPNDYAGLVMMSKCLMFQEKFKDAERSAEKAQQVYPKESQAYHLSGFAKMQTGQFDAAYQEFVTCEQMLPGNPSLFFFKGLCLEKMNRKPQAAEEYKKYLQVTQQGKEAQYAYGRLKEWGYIK